VAFPQKLRYIAVLTRGAKHDARDVMTDTKHGVRCWGVGFCKWVVGLSFFHASLGEFMIGGLRSSISWYPCADEVYLAFLSCVGCVWLLSSLPPGSF